MRPIRILLADDHELVRAGLRALLNKVADVEVVAEAGDGREALRLIEEHRPDVGLSAPVFPSLPLPQVYPVVVYYGIPIIFSGHLPESPKRQTKRLEIDPAFRGPRDGDDSDY